MPLRWFRRAPPPRLIDDAIWTQAVAGVPAARRRSAADLDRLRALSEDFLRSKTISGARGFEVTAAVRAAIALQACLPVLELGLRAYDDFIEIVVYPAQFKVHRRQVDDAGVVHEAHEWLAGEAMQGGPVVLSWEDAAPHQDDGAANVVMHEFIHKLDMIDGDADGVPPLPAGQRQRWQRVLDACYDDFCDRLDRLERSIPPDIDPESAEADDWYLDLILDPYAATDPAEFFAVCGEVFFDRPAALHQMYPEWYQLLARFFRHDPMTDESAAMQHN